MKKLLTGVTVIILGVSIFGQVLAQSVQSPLDNAISWLYQNGYTIFSNTKDYKPDNYMRRDEAAKFFVKIAKDMNVSYIKTEAPCSFPDLNEGHADLKNDIIESCRMGIFQGGNGKFNPTGSLTNAQAITVLLRIVSGRESEVGVTHWADNYYNKAYTLGYLSALPVLNNKDGLVTRGTVAQLVSYNHVNIGVIVNRTNTYQGDGFSFQYPSDGVLNTTNSFISNYTHPEDYFTIWAWSLWIKELGQKCIDYLNNQENGFYTIENTFTVGGKNVYEGQPEMGRFLCFDKNGLGIKIETTYPRIISVVKNSLSL